MIVDPEGVRDKYDTFVLTMYIKIHEVGRETPRECATPYVDLMTFGGGSSVLKILSQNRLVTPNPFS